MNPLFENWRLHKDVIDWEIETPIGIITFLDVDTDWEQIVRLLHVAPLMLEALRAVEWIGIDSHCPWCGGSQHVHGHLEYCKRQAALAAAEEGDDGA